KSDVLPKPNARRKCTPAPSRVGLDRTRRLTGRMDIVGLRDERFVCKDIVFRKDVARPGERLCKKLVDEFAASLVPIDGEVAINAGDMIGAEKLTQYNHDGVGEVHRQIGVLFEQLADALKVRGL